MPQSLSKIYIHIVFHKAKTAPPIDDEHLGMVHNYIFHLVRETNCIPLIVGGVGDHVHALVVLGRQMTVAKLVEEMKRHSSRWIKTLSPAYSFFSWQGGYAAFSVSQSLVEKTVKYIENQKEHHKRVGAHEEYLLFLRQYKIEYDEDYLFDS